MCKFQSSGEHERIQEFEFVEEEKIMIKNIAIVSLSSGTIGEDFVKHEVDIGIKRLNDFDLNVRFMVSD